MLQAKVRSIRSASKIDRLVVGDIPDLSFIYVNNELGRAEMGLLNNGNNGAKETNEKNIEVPKIMINFCWKLINDHKVDPKEVKVIGIVEAHGVNEESRLVYLQEEIEDCHSSNFVTLKFKEYLAACVNASSPGEKIDLHFNRVIPCNDGEKHPFFVDLSENRGDSTKIEVTFDTDAFIYAQSTVVPVLNGIRCNVFLSPLFSEQIQRLEFGSVARWEEDIRKTVMINLKHMPHTLLFSADYGALVKCFIFFPAMYEKESKGL